MRGTFGLLAAAALLIPACSDGHSVPGAVGGPMLTLTGGPLAFACDEGGSDPLDQTIVLSRAGDLGVPVNWTVSADQPWLSISPSSGTLAPNSSVNLTVSVDAHYQLQGWAAAPPTAGAPSARWVHSMAWTGSEVVVWGGSVSVAPSDVDSGGRYDPAGNTWIGATTLTGAPTPRRYSTAVWTGADILFWGGTSAGGHNTGFFYHPDVWAGGSTTSGAPGPREAHTAVWTGTEMIVWGGWDGTLLNTGARYSPAGDVWTGTTSTVGATARQEHAGVWTGSRMIVWGGRNGVDASSSLATGAIYDPSTNSWVGTPANLNRPSARTAPSAVWTGHEMIVWGGHDGVNRLNTGARYNPAMDAWVGVVPLAGAPSARWRHRAVWTGSRMVVWGGEEGAGMTNTGGVYLPPIPAFGDHVATITVDVPGVGSRTTDVDLAVGSPAPSIDLAPSALSFSATTGGANPAAQQVSLNNPAGFASTLAWTAAGDRPWLQVSPSSGTTTTETDLLGVAAVVVQAEAWTTDTTTTAAPAGREDASAVWTGREMIVWGGNNGGTKLDSGARYDPALDQWTSSTSTAGAPSPRWGQSAVWTGSEMIVWGGGNGTLKDDGYRYDPATNTWSGPISTAGAPSARRVHAAVWTGTQMIVWGGLTSGGPTATGARYTPATDTWSPMATVNAPVARNYQAAAWTGSEMILVSGSGDPGIVTGRYDPATDSWGTPPTTAGMPTVDNPCAAWTGSELIVWSGFNGATQPTTGARYDPAADAWQPMTTTGALSGRRSGVGIWTGLEMIAWGGYDGAAFQNTGKRYRPPIALPAGVHLGTVTVLDPAASNSPRAIPVTFTVGP
jgi:N-acetylneuraminic acid mutarotase